MYSRISSCLFTSASKKHNLYTCFTFIFIYLFHFLLSSFNFLSARCLKVGSGSRSALNSMRIRNTANSFPFLVNVPWCKMSGTGSSEDTKSFLSVSSRTVSIYDIKYLIGGHLFRRAFWLFSALISSCFFSFLWTFSVVRCWACTPPGSVRHSWARLSRIPTRYRATYLVMSSPLSSNRPCATLRCIICFFLSLLLFEWLFCPVRRIGSTLIRKWGLGSASILGMRNRVPVFWIAKRSFMVLRFVTFLLEGLKGLSYECAADFSLLNLPKGKSLGRSKPATNS